MTNAPELWIPLLASGLTAAAAICDLRTGLIPNRLVAWGAGATLLLTLALAYPHGTFAMVRALTSLALGLVMVSLIPVLLYRMDGLGGGDVKLLAVVGAALGPYAGLEAEMYAFACALLYAPMRLLWEGKLRQSLRTAARVFLRPLLPRSRQLHEPTAETMTAFRFGPAIFLGTLTSVVLRVVATH